MNYGLSRLPGSPLSLRLIREIHAELLRSGRGAAVNLVRADLSVTFVTANKLIGRFEQLGLVREITGQRRSRRFRYDPYLRLFDTGVDDPPPEVPAQVTGAGSP